MQILIPMGGKGSRFLSAGYTTPKPFIDVLGKPMIELVIENLGFDNDYILVVQREHFYSYIEIFHNIEKKVNSLQISLLDEITMGPADSCLTAINMVNHKEPIMIANSDQWMDWNKDEFIKWFNNTNYDGVLMTFNSQHEKNSYAEIDSNSLVIRTVEKEVISQHASNGIYVWRLAMDFFSAIIEMIEKDLKTNNEFYVAPAYNINIKNGQKIGIYSIGNNHWPIGTPEDLEKFLEFKNANI